MLNDQEGGMRSPPRCSALGRLQYDAGAYASGWTKIIPFCHTPKPNTILQVVPLGEASVLIAVASEHRAEAESPGKLHMAVYSERGKESEFVQNL